MTTLIDYYALPAGFPGMAGRPDGTPNKRACHVETEWEKRIEDPRFHPFLMVHEFEALLFSKPDVLCKTLYQSGSLRDLMAIRASFDTPEDINGNPLTAPSKHILKLLSGHQKALHGPMVTKRIGMETLCGECPHFKEWIGWLESL